MEDDDEFGDLYTDVLRPFSSSDPSQPPIFSSTLPGSSANPSSYPNNHSGDENFLFEAPNSSSSALTYNAKKEEINQIPEESNHGASNCNDSDRMDELEKKDEEELDKEAARASDSQFSNSSKADVLTDLDNGNVELQQAEDARVSENREALGKSGMTEAQDEDGGNKNGSLIGDGGLFQEGEAGNKEDIVVGVDVMEPEPIIPGLSGGSFIPGVFEDSGNGESSKAAAGMEDRDGARDDWDSDSEDDLQIVLNDNTGPVGMDMKEGVGSDDEDEDGEDLIIVADGDQHHPPMEEQEWGDDSSQAPDGERKEGGDAVKANGGMVNAVGARIGYSNHGYHPHHSQFKYVRPGAAVMPGGSFAGPGGVPGQVRPPITMGPVAGRGRGDWRPTGVKTVPTMQKGFHSGFGPAWGNNSMGRGFGGGLEFTLPSHK